MSKQHILIIGGSSDIALATAAKFSLHGFRVSLTARTPSELAERISDLSIRSGHEVGLFTLDVCDGESRARFLAELPETPDVVLWCVGYLGDQNLAQHDPQEAARILDTNLCAAVQILNPLVERLSERRSGTLIAISSVAGDRGRASNYFYAAAKSGLSTYLSGLRNRLFEAGVHVIDVRPGFVDTRMTADMDLPARLTAQPDQVADAIYRGWRKQRNTVYVKPVWRLIMLIIRLLPEAIFKRTNL